MSLRYGSVLYAVKGSVAIVTLNRPEFRNALGGTIREDIIEVMAVAEANDSVRAIILTGAGSAFCSGGDLNELYLRAVQGQTIAEKTEPIRDRTLLAVYEAKKPVIAAVNGPAMGAGMNLALAADIRIASKEARFSQAHTMRGMMPDYGGTYLLPALLGSSKAYELICTGATLDAEEALRLGLVSDVVEPSTLMDRARTMAQAIALNAPIPIRLAKRAVQQHNLGGLREALARETAAQNVCYESQDAREGLRSFLEKRTPTFQGK
ncbi:enoyl-CoA hydratase/isomerase family protein [Cupriavidus metallidurans]|uniref:Enoyl-CoA hydratase/isomerase n=1 Tax=Cupriavidus metallidurans (strain ATCC 43123 / DSM 2839 / NBRC 102507 / CH34) TaxID=266264 RepID=Q1LBR0_CUPMC|nr:enoyl-CoA hydratase/isomerase family protein [Cupriavidus metallidurans]ABF12416.1 Enoyl-CoA hydratase/isomerase [Cupriavidus metallidurans CH34]QGS32357.1 enoyl-CoA hydratase/isomerase family protein [Cupriavidus metallidurans]